MKRIALVASLALLLASCGGDEPQPVASPTETESPTTPTTTASPSPSPTETETTPMGTQVTTAESSLGTILTDADGRTLYVLMNDTEGESTCYDSCAENWPALIADGEPQAGEGVDASLLGTAERRDGALQVTYNGRPVYRFAGDQGPGDTNGQGIGGVWFVVSPEGEPVGA